MISSFHGMIPSFHAVFGLRHRDKSAKVIDYNDQVIRVREYLLFRGIPSPMFFSSAERGSALQGRMQCTARTDAVHCGSGCSALRLRGVKLALTSSVLFWIREKGGKAHHKGSLLVPREYLRNRKVSSL